MDCKEFGPGRGKSFEDAIQRAITSCQPSGSAPGRVSFHLKRYGLVLWMIIMNTSYAMQHTDYIAHRGASWLAPENTMASVMLAWQLNADAVEIDVYLTRDNQVVVIHDEDTKRVSGVDLKVSEASLEELQKLDVGVWKDKKYAGEKIPLLADVIKTIPKGKKLYVEIKSKEEILPFLYNIISQSGKRGQITFISFDLEVLAKAKEQMPDVGAYWLVEAETNKLTNEPVPHNPELLKKVVQNKIDGLDVDYTGVNKIFIEAVKACDQNLLVWTVDDPETANKMIEWGVKGITTNRPKWLKDQVEKDKKSGVK